VTNGGALPTFLHQTWMDFFDRELGRDGASACAIRNSGARWSVCRTSATWATAQEVKARMLASVRERLQREYEAKGLSPAQLRHVTRSSIRKRPGVLTLGFARRFAHLQTRDAAAARPRRASRGWSTIPAPPSARCTPARRTLR